MSNLHYVASEVAVLKSSITQLGINTSDANDDGYLKWK